MRLEQGQRYRARVNVDAPRFLVSKSAVSSRFEKLGFSDVAVLLSEPADVDAWYPDHAPPGAAIPAPMYLRSGAEPGWVAYVEGTWERPTEDATIPRPIEAAWPIVSPAYQPAGGILPTYISRATVLDYVRKLDPAIQAFAAEVDKAAKQPSEAWRASFDGWREKWAQFRNDCEGTFVMLDAVSRLDTAEAYAADLENWKKTWAKETGQSSSLPNPVPLPQPGISTPSFIAGAVLLAGVLAVLAFARR